MRLIRVLVPLLVLDASYSFLSPSVFGGDDGAGDDDFGFDLVGDFGFAPFAPPRPPRFEGDCLGETDKSSDLGDAKGRSSLLGETRTSGREAVNCDCAVVGDMVNSFEGDFDGDEERTDRLFSDAGSSVVVVSALATSGRLGDSVGIGVGTIELSTVVGVSFSFSSF